MRKDSAGLSGFVERFQRQADPEVQRFASKAVTRNKMNWNKIHTKVVMAITAIQRWRWDIRRYPCLVDGVNQSIHQQRQNESGCYRQRLTSRSVKRDQWARPSRCGQTLRLGAEANRDPFRRLDGSRE